MRWRQRLSELFGSRASAFDGTVGRPPSGNGASSFHLFWEHDRRTWVAAEATLEVAEPPRSDDLHFWALQVNLHDGKAPCGGAHLGLQWIAIHPGHTAVNWGGYGPDGNELRGTDSALASRPGNVNTRDFDWLPKHPYRLRVRQAEPAPGGLGFAWRGEVVDLVDGATVVIRDLFSRGDRLDTAMVWSEVFAPCDAAPTAVRWSDLALIDELGDRVAVTAATVNYQSIADGGCTTTDTGIDGDGGQGAFVQRTGAARRTPQGSVLRLG